MSLQRVLPFTKSLLEQAVSPGDTVIDATAGNGHDTYFLAKLIGSEGKVYAFDIQQEAMDATSLRTAEFSHVQLILDSHDRIDRYVKENISAAVFNLGYLPKGDHSIITKAASTLSAMNQCLERLQVNGLLLMVVYSGHEGGSEERDAVLEFVRQLPQASYDVAQYSIINQSHSPPFLLAIEKKRTTD